MNIKALGLKIAQLRDLGGFSQDSLALKSGVARNAISSLEKGKGNPTVSTLEALARTLGVPLTEFFGVAEGGRVPLEHYTPAVHAANKQLTKGKRASEAAQLEQARGKRMDTSNPDPADLYSGLEFVGRFAGQGRDTQLAVMALVYEDVGYLKQLSPAFRAQLVRLLSLAKT